MHFYIILNCRRSDMRVGHEIRLAECNGKAFNKMLQMTIPWIERRYMTLLEPDLSRIRRLPMVRARHSPLWSWNINLINPVDTTQGNPPLSAPSSYLIHQSRALPCCAAPSS